MEGNFGSRKIWQIHCINTLAEENLANCKILQAKISWKTYSVKHNERYATRQICDASHRSYGLRNCEICCDAMHALQLFYPPETSERESKSNIMVPRGPLFFTFLTSAFPDSVALGGTKLLKLDYWLAQAILDLVQSWVYG